MTTMLPPDIALLADMASLAGCDRAEGYACITARREHGASSVEIPQPQFVILLEGSKQVRTAHQSLTAHAGDMLLFTQRCRIDVVNTPEAGTGRYLGAIVPLCAEVLSAARTLWSEALPAPGRRCDRAAAADRPRHGAAALAPGTAGRALQRSATGLGRTGAGLVPAGPRQSAAAAGPKPG